jgi:DNA-binding transcriptional MerR regulator
MPDGMTIDELAELARMTPRNIRAHQSRGLLFKPRIQGRVARYSGAHAARLALITSLQQEGFTLAAIKRLLESPGAYSSVMADRRRGFRDATTDMPNSVPISAERLAQTGPAMRDQLEAHGLVWEQDGQLYTHTLLAGVTRTLADRGLPAPMLAELLLSVAECASTTREALSKRLAELGESDGVHPEWRADLEKVAAQLFAAGFELSFGNRAAG